MPTRVQDAIACCFRILLALRRNAADELESGSVLSLRASSFEPRSVTLEMFSRIKPIVESMSACKRAARGVFDSVELFSAGIAGI
jgi:hypothetical protein